MNSAKPSTADRLGVTILFSLIVHGVLAFGLGFQMPLPSPALPSLDVTLVQTANRQAPEDADFLAQADNSGGGTLDEARRPSQRFTSELPKPDPGTAPRKLDPSAPRAQAASGPTIVTTTGPSTRHAPSEPEQRQQAQRQVKPSPEVIKRKRMMARLAAEVRKREQRYAERPKIKYLSANTREYAYAAYMRAWVARVQRVGNLNYPAQARQRGLFGDLILTVVLRPDGSVKTAEIIQSSGHQLLDAAALRIVHLSAPFPPVPDKAGNYDVFNITRTWQFQANGKFKTRG